MERFDVLIGSAVSHLKLVNKWGDLVAVSVVDTADVPAIIRSGLSWKAIGWNGTHRVIATKNGPRGTRTAITQLSRFLVAPAPGLVVDHINRDPLDNRRANLRAVTHRENVLNRRRRKDTP